MRVQPRGGGEDELFGRIQFPPSIRVAAQENGVADFSEESQGSQEMSPHAGSVDDADSPSRESGEQRDGVGAKAEELLKAS